MTRRSSRQRDGSVPDVGTGDMHARVLPHDLDAEKAVLGAVLINNATYEKAANLLRPDHFFRYAHQLLFEAFKTIIDERRSAVDFITIRDELTRRGALDECGGMAYITGLTDGIPRTTNVGHYATIVREHAALRALIRTGNEMVVAAYDREEPVAHIIQRADRAVIALQRGSEPGRMVDLRDEQGAIYDEIERRINNKGKLTGVPTGWASFDELTMGWQPGELIVIGARPSMGKSIFALNTSVAAAQAGKHVAFFSLEMRLKALQMRILSSLSKVPAERIRTGFLGDDDIVALGVAMTEMGNLPLHIDDASGVTVHDIRSKCRQLRAEHGLDLVVVDYIQLVTGSLERRGATRTEELGDISRRLKVLADEVSAPVIALSQLKRGEGRPVMSDLRESGNLEQDADIVGLMHRKSHRSGGKTLVIFEKQRSGPTGTKLLELDRETQTFTDMGDEPEPVEAPPAPEGTSEEPKKRKPFRRRRPD